MGCAASKDLTASVAVESHQQKNNGMKMKSTSPTASMSEHRNVSEESLLQKSKSTQDPPQTQQQQQQQQQQEQEPPQQVGITVSQKGDFRKDWKVQPGYSSGASSYSGSDAGSLDGYERDGGLTSSRSQHALEVSRHSDILDLSTLRQEMMAEGDLTKTVVRIETPFGKPIEEIYEGVHDGPVLGSGVSGIVRLVAHRSTGIKYAVKCLDIGLIDSTEGLRQLRDEIFIMCQLDHPNIVRIDEVYESTNEIYIVQELCHGGDLFDRLDEQPDYHYTEAQCARLVKQMLSSVRYLHSKGVIHRDLKLENFLFSSTKPESELKMIDFGLSKHFLLGEHHHEKVGTPYTVAPEIIRGTYDEKSDLWSIGIITYLLLSGETPFGGLDGENLLEVKQNIMNAKLVFEPADVWSNVSDEAKEFVKILLNPDSTKRPTAKEAQKHAWIQVYAKKDTKEGNKLNANIVGALMGFKEYSDMQKLLSEVLSFTLLPEQIVELRDEFEKIDTDGDGEISLEQLKNVLMENAEAGALGALTEVEIEEIFDAIRIRKTEPTIRWHEFLAAGLSQAKVDDRNLRLAFDRLDGDRKGFISFDDMQDLVGGSMSGDLEKMWLDSLQECKAHMDAITYSDFKRLMKGQPKKAVHAADATAMMKRGGVNETSLMSVPEEKRQSSSDLPDADEADPSLAPHIRSRSFDLKESNDSIGSLPSRASPSWDANLAFCPPSPRQAPIREASLALILPSQADGEYSAAINDSSMSPLVVNRAIYRKHREMRLAVQEASKQFDLTRNQRRSSEQFSQAGLIMKRGKMPPVELEDAHQRALFDAAAKRCGRARTKRTRNKTVSDVTGMLLRSSQA